jgi:hypothetical protein
VPTTTIVVTSINAPNAALKALAEGCVARGGEFIVVGDTKSPDDFSLDGCRFLDVRAQLDTGLSFARACPLRHYARKNVGYLEAIRGGADVIAETDDDNVPEPAFFEPPSRVVTAPYAEGAGWVNVYRYFTATLIWPRGFPLDRIRTPVPAVESLPIGPRDCPIQQGLTDADPDVDAVYRLILPLPQSFDGPPALALGRGSWCPFNSQNTRWWREAHPLLYLPAYCSFRMTDIWRSFVAQRVAWAQGWSVLFHGPTVRHDRNEHDLMRDFEDEMPGYLNNRKIADTLDGLSLTPGPAWIPESMRRCYEALVGSGLLPETELALLDCWLADLDAVRSHRSAAS